MKGMGLRDELIGGVCTALSEDPRWIPAIKVAHNCLSFLSPHIYTQLKNNKINIFKNERYTKSTF